MTTGYTVAEVNRVRQVMASRMRTSASEIPQVTLQAVCDAARLSDKARAADTSLTTHLLAAVAHTLRRHPRLNSCVIDNEIRVIDSVNLGVAIATARGLVVPVIRNADELTPSDISKRLDDLRARGETGELRVEDLVDATFTVTNLGPYGVGHFNPLVNPPQVAILGVGAIATRVVPSGDEEGGTGLKVLPELPLSLTFDHAALDGAESATFLRDLVRHIDGYDVD